MSRAKIRELRKEWKEDLPAFFAAQKHFFPDLIKRFQEVVDQDSKVQLNTQSREYYIQL